jgi:hypothetical protein
VPHVQPRPQDPISPWLGPRGLKGVTTQVLHHLNKNANIYIYINTCFFRHFQRRSKKRGKEEA